MSFLGWMAVVGLALLILALLSAYLRRLPITTSAVYLAFGLALSPLGFDLIRIDFVDSKVWFEHLTEIAVIVSLFIGGLKLRLPLKNPAWNAAFRLAGPVMIASIIGVALLARFVFNFDWGVAFLLGAALAPTDPVLAGAVSVNDAADHDRMRYGISGEAGFNDGTAFPFVIFALLWIEHSGPGEWLGGWALHRLVWAVPAGLLLGYFLGKTVGRLAIWLRTRHQDTDAPNDFLALALIALAYVGAEFIYAWGFLSVFAAGVGLRRAEIKTVTENPLHLTGEPEPFSAAKTDENDSVPHPPAEEIVAASKIDEAKLEKPGFAAGVVVSEIISFGDTTERLLEILLVVLVGICLALYWDWRAVPLALAFFFLIRPLAAYILLWKAPVTRLQKLLMGWFGLRGIGSLYYLSYALNHDATGQARQAVSLTLSVVAISILLHGISVQPILDYYERLISEKGDGE
jgi:sodium/hydrogen antiporter